MDLKMERDEDIYRHLVGKVSAADCERMKRLIRAWAIATDEVDEEDSKVKIMFLACVHVIGTMGPAYCNIAAATLAKRANEYDVADNRVGK